MVTSLQELMSSLEMEIKDIERSDINIIQRSKTIIRKIRDYENNAKKILKYKFKDLHEEIYFFKYLKPIFYSKLFYYNDIFNIECGRPNGSDKKRIKYIETHLEKINDHFIRNRSYYEYYRIGSIHLDDKYFTHIKRLEDKYDAAGDLIQCEDNFSSTHDILFAKIISNDMLEKYLIKQISKLSGENSELNGKEPTSTLTWTDSKASAVEFIYAIYFSCSINNGNADVKEVASSFEKMYNIDLGDYYRTYCEIRLRTNRTRYLDTLKERLVRKMDEKDEGASGLKAS